MKISIKNTSNQSKKMIESHQKSAIDHHMMTLNHSSAQRRHPNIFYKKDTNDDKRHTPLSISNIHHNFKKHHSTIMSNNNNSTRLEHRCAYCNNPGHTSGRCPWTRTMQQSCNFCNQRGHITMHCPHRPQQILAYLQQHHNIDIICSFCLQPGHLYPTCPFYQSRMRAFTPPNLTEHNTTAHLGEFTESPEPINPLCNNCRETGHSILQCPHITNNTTSLSPDTRIIYQTAPIQPTATIPIMVEQPDEHICTASCEASPSQLAPPWNSPTHNNREVSPTPSNHSNIVYNSDTLTSILEAYGMHTDLPNTYVSSQPPEPSQPTNITLSPEPSITTHLTDTYPSATSIDLIEDILHRFQAFLDEWDEDRLLEDWSQHDPTHNRQQNTLNTLRQLSRQVINSINDLMTFTYNNTEEPDPEDNNIWRWLHHKHYTTQRKQTKPYYTTHRKPVTTTFDCEDTILKKGVMSRLALQPVPSLSLSRHLPIRRPLIHISLLIETQPLSADWYFPRLWETLSRFTDHQSSSFYSYLGWLITWLLPMMRTDHDPQYINPCTELLSPQLTSLCQSLSIP